MKVSFADWLIILVFGVASFFHFRGFGFGPAGEIVTGGVAAEEVLSLTPSMRLESGEKRRLLLFILDFRDFSCMVCLESFLELYQRLPLQVKVQNSWGILIVPPGQEKDESVIGIAEKKLKGFIRAHQILFPVLVDRFQVFGEVADRGSGIVLLDEERQEVMRFDFPLKGGQFQEILDTFVE